MARKGRTPPRVHQPVANGRRRGTTPTTTPPPTTRPLLPVAFTVKKPSKTANRSQNQKHGLSQLTDSQRGEIIGRRKGGAKYAEIAKYMSLSVSTVRAVILDSRPPSRANQERSRFQPSQEARTNGKKPGRLDRMILRFVFKNPYVSYDQIREEFGIQDWSDQDIWDSLTVQGFGSWRGNGR